MQGKIDYRLLVKTGLKIGKNKEGAVFCVLSDDAPEYVIFNSDRSVLLNVNKNFDFTRCGTVIGYQSLDDLLGAADSIGKVSRDDEDISEEKAGIAELIENSASNIQSLFDEDGNISREDLLSNRESILSLMDSVDDYCFSEEDPEDDDLPTQ